MAKWFGFSAKQTSTSEDELLESPPLRTKPWQRAVSVTMSVLLAATMFDATGLSPLFTDAVADEPSASQAAPEGEDSAADEAVTTDETAEGADQEGENSATDSASDDAIADDNAADEGAEEPVPAVNEAEEIAKLLPEGLYSADAVLPADFEGDADISSRINPTMTLFGAPMVSAKGFMVKNGAVSAEYTLGNLAALLEEGALGGSTAGDAVVLTFELPYLYYDAAGELQRTYSEELWKVRRGITAENGEAGAAPLRAALYADAVPAGWSAWQEHGGAYLPLTDADLKAGVSGKVVLRYEGELPAGLTAQEAANYNGPLAATAPNAQPAALTAAASMPTVSFGLIGAVPADEQVTVRFGYEARSFTPAATEEEPAPATEYGRAMVKTLGSVNLTNDEVDAAASVAVENVENATINSDGGYLVSAIQIDVPKGKPAVSGVSLSGLWPTDANGFGGVPEAVLMAFKEENGEAVANTDADGRTDTSKDARKRSSFIGVPGKGGVVIVDVTDLSDAERATLDFKDASTLEALGVSPIPYTVDEEGFIAATLEGDEGAVKAGEGCTLYVAAPYALSAMELEEAAEALPGAHDNHPLGGEISAGTSTQKFKPVQNVLDVSVLVRTQAQTVALPHHFRGTATFTRTADPVAPATPATPEGEGSAEGDGEGEGDEDGEGDEPAADEPAADESQNGYTPPQLRRTGGAHEHGGPRSHQAGQRHGLLHRSSL